MPNGGVASGHPLASMAGVRMLMQGGTAADAAVAAMAVLNVVEPWASSAAGNGFATCLDKKTGEVVSLAFTGAAPGLLDNQVDPAELVAGHKAAVTPGAFGGWIELARRFGRLPLSTLLEPAIDYARDGHPIDASIVDTIRRQQLALARYPTTAAIYLPGGQPPAPRSLFKNLPLARTFQALADAETTALNAGADRNAALQAAYDHFYLGPVAQEMARFSEAGGGWLRMKDFKDYRPQWAAPVNTRYRGVDVYCSPLTSRTGLEMCEQLNLLEGFDIGRLPADSPQAIHLLAETIKVAKSDVYRYAADPTSASVPVTFTQRTDVWAFVWDEFVKRPIRGWGFGGFWDIDPGVQPSLQTDAWFAQPDAFTNEAHNGFLDLAVTTGLVGLVGAVVILFRWLGGGLALIGQTVGGQQPQAFGAALVLGVFPLMVFGHNFMESSYFTANSIFGTVLLLLGIEIERRFIRA